MDEPRAYYTECSKSARERQILYINAYIWNLERWYQRTYVQSSKGNTVVKNSLLDSAGEGEGGMIWENSIETYTLPYVKQITSESLLYDARNPKAVLYITLMDGVEREVGRGFRREGTHVCLRPMHIDVWQKTIIILQSNYPPIKIFKKQNGF